LRFVLDLVAGARAAIERGELQSYKEDALARLRRSGEAEWAAT
jgi:queuine/archaeosine tRNA-ribosyltransferase